MGTLRLQRRSTLISVVAVTLVMVMAACAGPAVVDDPGDARGDAPASIDGSGDAPAVTDSPGDSSAATDDHEEVPATIDDPAEVPAALAISGRRLDGGIVDLASFAGSPVAAWMWAPW